MPVSPVANVNQPPAPAHAGAPAPGFADALATQLAVAPRTAGAAVQPITLGQMMAFRAGSPATAQAAQSLLAAPPAAPPRPTADAGATATSSASGNRVVDTARRYLGIPYKWGGTNPRTGLDCSGFTQRVFADLGVKIPRVSIDQSRAGQAVQSLAQARPGDLVYWHGKNGRPNHIGIYMGNGQMMHAPRTGDVVKVAPLRSAPPDAIRRVA
jgi:peptidoglycan DL-endopeptidase CwlO